MPAAGDKARGSTFEGSRICGLDMAQDDHMCVRPLVRTYPS